MPTPAASSRHITCWHPVPEAATTPTGPGRTALANPRPTPPTIAVPQSGPITSTPARSAARLSATSCSTGTLSLNTITSRPASTASIASTSAEPPGTETSASPASPRASALAVVRGGASCSGPPSPRVFAAVSAASTAASAASTEPSSSSRKATTMSLVVLAGTSKPIEPSTSRLSGVAMATWAAAMPGWAATSRLTASSVTESE